MDSLSFHKIHANTSLKIINGSKFILETKSKNDQSQRFPIINGSKFIPTITEVKKEEFLYKYTSYPNSLNL